MSDIAYEKYLRPEDMTRLMLISTVKRLMAEANKATPRGIDREALSRELVSGCKQCMEDYREWLGLVAEAYEASAPDPQPSIEADKIPDSL